MSAGPVGWPPGESWRLERLDPIAPPPGIEGELINPTSLSFGDDNRLFVGDLSPATVKVFDRSGRFVRRIGGDGDGPGEFRSAAATVAGSRLIVHDARSHRTSIFDTSGAFRTSWVSAGNAYYKPVALVGGRVGIPALVRSDSAGTQWSAGYVDFDSSFAPLDSVLLPQGTPPGVERRFWKIEKGGKGGAINAYTGIPFQPTVTSRRLGSGTFVFGYSGAYQFAEGPRYHDTTRIFGRAWQAVPIADQRRQEAVEQTIQSYLRQFDEIELRKAFRLEDVPQTSPAFLDFYPDPSGRLWVRVATENDLTSTTLDVFDDARRYLGQVVAPDPWPESARAVWGNGVLAAAFEDADGRPVIVRYRLVKQ
jgi:hypothetical protein